MKWIIPAANHHVWSDFSIEIRKVINFKTGNTYQLNGDNGSGKSSFIKKILIPQLLANSTQQYLLYIEQQIQSQFDAIKSYAALQKPAIHINTFRSMAEYQFRQLSQFMKIEARPFIVIIDECLLLPEFANMLSEFAPADYCLISVSHQKSDTDTLNHANLINFKVVNKNLSSVFSI